MYISDNAGLGSTVNLIDEKNEQILSPHEIIKKRYGWDHCDLMWRPSNNKEDSITVPASLANIITVLKYHPHWQYRPIKKSTFLYKAFIGEKEIDEAVIIDLTVQLHKQFFRMENDVSPEKVANAIKSIAYNNEVSELLQYFINLKEWDGVKRIEIMPKAIFGTNKEFASVLLKKWLISLVAVAYCPGTAVEGLLLLQGNKGLGKSTFFRLICPELAWFFEGSLNLQDDKSCGENIRGKAVCELAEFLSMQKAGRNAYKAFITRSVDTFRGSYAHDSNSKPRQCIFGSTSNEQSLIDDSDNERRFWCIDVLKQLDIEWLKANKEQIWAEAKALYLAGEKHYCNPTEREQLYKNNEDSLLESTIQVFIEENIQSKLLITTNGRIAIKSNDLLTLLKDYQGGKSSQAYSAAMQTLGWKNERGYFEPGKQLRLWVAPLDFKLDQGSIARTWDNQTLEQLMGSKNEW